MNREYHRWYSPSLGREMELLIFGHAGARMLVFPTSMGKFYEWEDRGMIAALGACSWKTASCKCTAWTAWMRKAGMPGTSTRPTGPGGTSSMSTICSTKSCRLLYQKNPTPYLIVAGASFGAYHAMNFALRHPDITNRVIAMSGMFNIERWLGSYRDDNTYYNCPCLYLPNEVRGRPPAPAAAAGYHHGRRAR